MSETFFITLNQILKLFIFMAIGFVFQKTKMYPKEFSSVLSKLNVQIFMPALVFNTFSTNFKVDVIRENSTYLISGIVLLLASVAIAIPLAMLFTKDRDTRMVFVYSFTIPNLGYMGYPMIEAVFGETALFHLMIFALPFNIFIYTVGITILNPKRELSLKKLLNPTIIAIIVGIVFGIFNLKLPSFLSSACDLGAGCMSPVAMLLSGYVLAKNPIKKLLADPKMYLAAIIRLVGIPALAFIGMTLVGVRSDVILIGCAMLSMPLGLNTVVFPEAFGGDSSTGSKSCFVSNILGLITIPIMFALLTAFTGGMA